MKVCYKDLHIFDTKTEKWISKFENEDPDQIRPEQRMYHSSAVFGNIMMIHGGLNTEDKTVYDDLFLYNIDIHTWISIKRPKTFYESNIGKRWMHSMTTVISSECKSKNSLSIWAKYSKETNITIQNQFWGVYMFGGSKDGITATNDLFLIRPNHKLNSELFTPK